MTTGTLTFDENTTAGKILLSVLKASPEYVFKIEKTKKHRKSSLDKSLDDLEAGRVFEAKDGKDLVRQCLE